MQISDVGVINVQNSSFNLGKFRPRGANKARKDKQKPLPPGRKFKIQDIPESDCVNIIFHGNDQDVMREQELENYFSREDLENYHSRPVRLPPENERNHEHGSTSQQNFSGESEESYYFKTNGKDLCMKNQQINGAVSSNIISEYSLLSDCECLHLQADIPRNSDCEQDVIYDNMQSYGQSHLHELSDAECLKQLCTSKESIHFFRVETLRKRMLITLDKIHNLIDKIPQPDGVEDLKRRQQRSAEFSARFCRNYLYQIQRQINDIRKQLRSVPTAGMRQTYHLLLCQKMVGAHQNAQQALQAYLHHMPCGVEKGIPDKLQELLYFVKELCCFCSETGITSDCETGHDEIMKKSQDILGELMARDSFTSLSHGSLHKKGKKHCKKKTVQERYAMYNSTSKWKSYCKEMANNSKKKAAALANEKEAVARTDSKKVSPSLSATKLNITAEQPETRVQKNIIPGSSAMDSVTTMMDTIPPEDEEACVFPHARPAVSSMEELPSGPLEKEKEDFNKAQVDKGKKAKRHKCGASVLNVESLHTIQLELEQLQDSVKDPSNIANYQDIFLKLQRYLLDFKAYQPGIIAKQKEQGKQEQPQEIQQKQQEHREQQIQQQEEEEAAKYNENFKQSTSQKKRCSVVKNVKLICLPSEDSARKSPETQSSVPHPKSKHTMLTEKHPSSKQTSNLQANPLLMSYHISGESGSDLDAGVRKPAGWNPPQPSEPLPIKIPDETETKAKHHNTPRTPRSTSSSSTLGRKEVASAEPVQLSISHQELASALAYRRRFQQYMKSQSKYQEPKRPWLMVGRIANFMIENILYDVLLNDVGIQRITQGLLELEFR